MNTKILVSATIATLAAAIVPADAAWKQYFNKDAVFSFNAPEGVKRPKQTTEARPRASAPPPRSR